MSSCSTVTLWPVDPLDSPSAEEHLDLMDPAGCSQLLQTFWRLACSLHGSTGLEILQVTSPLYKIIPDLNWILVSFFSSKVAQHRIGSRAGSDIMAPARLAELSFYVPDLPTLLMTV